MDNIIEIENLSYEYEDNERNKKIFKNFNLSIKRNSFTVILGHNGSGKSTLAKLLNGLYKPNKGTVRINGLSTSEAQNELEIHKTVGMVFQNPDNQIVASVVEEDVAFGPENLGLPSNVIRGRVDDALKAVGMYEFREYSPAKLSGGQKQRIAIAGILAMEPQCIVLDEPTAMLDPKGRREVIDTIKSLNKEKGITVVLITHFMNEAEEADRVIVINDGQIAADDTPKKVFSDSVLIRGNGLDLPQTTELLYELSKIGINVNNSAISVEDTAKAIMDIL